MDAPDRSGWYPPEPGAPAIVSPAVVSPGPARRGPRRSRIGTGVALAAIGVGALGVAGTAYAASSSPSPSPAGSANAPGYGASGAAGAAPGQAPHRARGMVGAMGGPRGRMHDGFGGMGIHGSFVTPKPGGGYQTVDTQVGTVAGVSTTSITLTSVDGFSQSYVVDAGTVVDAQRDGIASVKSGDEVAVVATVSGSTCTAVRIEDRTQVGGMQGRFGRSAGRHPGWPNGPGGIGAGPTGRSGPTGIGTPSSGGTA